MFKNALWQITVVVLVTFLFITLSHASETDIVVLKLLLKKGVITQKEYDEVINELKNTTTVEPKNSVANTKEEVKKEEDVTAQAGGVKEEEAAASGQEKSFVDSIDINGNVIVVGQGTVENSDNVPPGSDVTDAVLRADLKVSAPVYDVGTVYINLRAGAGFGLGGEGRLSAFYGVNGVEHTGKEDFHMNEAWYEHTLFDNKILFTVGKVDLTNYFDTNVVANDEATQFLAGGFINNIAVEFPANTMGARLTLAPNELYDVSVGWQPGDGVWENVFSKPFIIGEVALHPQIASLKGNYRLYGWTNRKEHEVIENPKDYAIVLPRESASKRQDIEIPTVLNKDGWGFGTSIDQQVYSNITLFGRVGYQNDNIYPFDIAWSTGFDINGDMWSRTDDILGFAYGMAHLSSRYEDELRYIENLSPKTEKHMEVYYSLKVNDKVYISPDAQLFMDALGQGEKDTIWALALRGTFNFR